MLGKDQHRKPVLTFSVRWCHVITFFLLILWLQAIQFQQKTPARIQCDSFYLWHLNSSTSAIQCISGCLYFSDLECCIEFAAFWGAGQAWPRSKHTGSLLPNTLRGKSPCLGAESATGRPEDLYSGAVSEALVELWFWCLVLCSSKVMPWAFARTPTERGSLFPCLPPADVGQRSASQASLDFQCLMMPRNSIFSLDLVVASHSVSTKNASQNTMRQLLFVTSQFVNVSNTTYQQLLVRFWFGMLHWICSFWGAGQAWPRSKHTGSLLPNTLRGKSPCLGAESATGRPEDLYPGAFSEALVELWFWCLVLCSSKVMPWAFARTPTERGSLFPCLPPADVGQRSASQANLDFQCQMMPRNNIFPLDLVVASHSVLTKNASQNTMRQLLFVTSQFVNVSNTTYQQLLVRFWFGMLHWICSFWGAGQAWPRSKHTGSLLPNTLRGKSPCLGAESATGRPEDLYSGAVSEALVELWFWCLVLCSSKVMPWAFARTPTERGSLFPCLPPADVRQRWHRKPILTFSVGWCHVITLFLLILWLQAIQF